MFSGPRSNGARIVWIDFPNYSLPKVSSQQLCTKETFGFLSDHDLPNVACVTELLKLITLFT